MGPTGPVVVSAATFCAIVFIPKTSATCVKLFAINFPTVYTNINFYIWLATMRPGKLLSRVTSESRLLWFYHCADVPDRPWARSADTSDYGAIIRLRLSAGHSAPSTFELFNPTRKANIFSEDFNRLIFLIISKHILSIFFQVHDLPLTQHARE